MSERTNPIQDPQICEVGGVAIIHLTKLGKQVKEESRKI
jgi:hypothetical protein